MVLVLGGATRAARARAERRDAKDEQEEIG
jgi:hypothetical protein